MVSKIIFTLLGLVLIASACGVDRESDNALDSEESTPSSADADAAGADGEEDGAETDDVDADDATTVTSPPLPPSDPPVTGPANDVAIDVDFGDEQWQLTHGELNEVALSVWDSDDFILRGFGGAVPPGFYATVAGEHLVGKVLERQLAEVGAESSDADREEARGALLELVESWYSDSADPGAEAETLLAEVPYLGFVADLQASQQVLIDAIAGDGGAVTEVPCVSHILVDEEAQAQEVIAELDGGADFAELAVERSVGPSGPSGGELGCASASNYVPEFAQAVETAEVGAYVGPVQTQFGWHVLVVEGFEEQPADPTVELNDRISSTLASATVEVDPVIGTWDTDALRIVEVPSEAE